MNNNHYNLWDEITDPFPNFNGATVDVCNEYVISSYTLWVCDKLSMGLKFNHVSKRGPYIIFNWLFCSLIN